MAKPVLHGPSYSTYTRSVRIALAEKGVDYELREVDFINGGFPDGYEALHPLKKVPAFEHDGFRVYETVAILRYVDEAFDGPALQSTDVNERTRMTQAMSVSDSYLYQPAVHGVFIQRALVPSMGGTTDEALVAESASKAGQALAALDGLIGDRAYLSGASFSLADAHLVPIIDYFRQTPEGETALSAVANVARWWDAVSGRESVQATTPKLG